MKEKELKGQLMIQYGCGHSYPVSYILNRHPKYGTKTLSYTVNIEDDLALCGYCKFEERVEKKGG